MIDQVMSQRSCEWIFWFKFCFIYVNEGEDSFMKQSFDYRLLLNYSSIGGIITISIANCKFKLRKEFVFSFVIINMNTFYIIAYYMLLCNNVTPLAASWPSLVYLLRQDTAWLAIAWDPRFACTNPAEVDGFLSGCLKKTSK